MHLVRKSPIQQSTTARTNHMFNKHNFLKNKKLNPLLKEFILNDFEAAVLQLPVDEQLRIFTSGKIINQACTAILEDFENGRCKITPSELVLKSLAYYNRDFFTITKRAKEEIANNKSSQVMDMITSTVELEDNVRVSPDAYIETITSSLEFIVKNAPSLSSEDENINSNHDKYLSILGNHGALYNTIREHWNKCLFFEASVEVDESGNLSLKDAEDSFAYYKEIGLNRFLSKEMEALFHLRGKDTSAGFLCVSDIAMEDLTIHDLTFGTFDGHETRIKDLIIKYVLEYSPYKAIYHKVIGVSINQLFKVYLFLVSMGVSVERRLIAEGNHNLENSTVKIKSKVLTDLISKHLDIPKGQTSKIIKLFTLDKSRGAELWSSPLIEVEDFIYLYLPCLTHVNIHRTMEFILSNNHDEVNKGTWFEKEVREDLEQIIKRSIIHSVGSELLKPARYTLGKKTEEIDLVLRIGTTLIVGELKCNVFSASTMGYLNLRTDLDQAHKQLERKSGLILENLEDFKKNYCNGHDIERIVCLIMTNFPLITGYSHNGIPVIDPSVLKVYMGRTHEHVSESRGGKSSNIKSINYYSSLQEAQDRLQRYLTKPLVIEPLMKSTSYQCSPLGAFQYKSIQLCYYSTFKTELPDEKAYCEYLETGNNEPPLTV